MNKETWRGDWNLLKGKIKEKWGKLTDHDLTEINGKREQLLGKLQKIYGVAKEKAEAQLAEWEKDSDEEAKLRQADPKRHAKDSKELK